MQRPDKWDEIARKIVAIEWELSPAVLCPAIAAALRDAEKAGMERAIHRLETSTFHRPTMGVVDACIAIIRVAKESNHEQA